MLGDYSWWEAGLFAVLVAVALIIDIRTHRENKPIDTKEAALWSAIWISLGLAFGIYVGFQHGHQDSLLYITAYLLEKSLSVDNLFVMMAVFTAFSIKNAYQHRILYYGILGAIIFRMIFIAAGVSFMEVFGKYALGIFGLIILWSAWKMWKASCKDNEEITDYSHHWSVKLTGKIFPVHHFLDGHNFFTKQNSRTMVTPLFLCLVTIEAADIMFAFDSIPAVLGVVGTPPNPFIVYTSNIFAILGLRSLYFLLAAAKNYLSHLEIAVIIILLFVGAKMILGLFDIHIHYLISLCVVIGLLALGVIVSLVKPEQKA